MLRNPCTSRCPCAVYQNPTIFCAVCCCLFHSGCIPMLPKVAPFVCQPCKQDLKERSTSCSLEMPGSMMDTQMFSNIPMSLLTPCIVLDTSICRTVGASRGGRSFTDLPPLPTLKKAPEPRVPKPISSLNVACSASSSSAMNIPVNVDSPTSASILKSKLQESLPGITPLSTFVQNTLTPVNLSQQQPMRVYAAAPSPRLPAVFIKRNGPNHPSQFSITIPPHTVFPLPDGFSNERAPVVSIFPGTNVQMSQPQPVIVPIVISKGPVNSVNQSRNVAVASSKVTSTVKQIIPVSSGVFARNAPSLQVSSSSCRTYSKLIGQNVSVSTQKNLELNSNSNLSSKSTFPTPERKSQRSKKKKCFDDFQSDSDVVRSDDSDEPSQSKKKSGDSVKAVACVKPQKAGGSSSLTDCLWTHIFKELNPADWLVAAQVCRNWKTLISQTSLWKDVSFKGLSIRDWSKCTEALKRNGTKTLCMRGLSIANSEETWFNFLKSIENLENIEHLSFDQVPPKTLEAVADALPLLRSLECCCLTATSKRPDLWETPCQLNFSNIRYLRKLRKLRIRSAGGLISQDANSVLQNLPELRHLSLTTVKVSASDHLNFLSRLQKLVSLEFGDCNTWTKENYTALGELKELRHVRLENGGDFRDNGLPDAIKQLKHLEELQLMNFRIPKNLGIAIRDLKHLKKLCLWPDISKQMAEANYNAFQCASHAKSIKSFIWGIISPDDSVPLLRMLKNPLQLRNKDGTDNVEELDYEDLFSKLLDVIPEDTKAEIKCISQAFFKEYCCIQR